MGQHSVPNAPAATEEVFQDHVTTHKSLQVCIVVFCRQARTRVRIRRVGAGGGEGDILALHLFSEE